ncbi:MAG TPA: tyrosine-protein phosphatase [Microbacterium sp.]|nr:tyrosine-protein phosphatase [Microbacterium sp.]
MQQVAIDGLFNVRATGSDAPWLVRSGATEGITRRGADELRRLGVSVVVDLREPDEAGVVAHGIRVLPVPVYGTPPPRAGRIEDIYAGLLRERGGALARAVAHIAGAERAALVHCTAGKDRTGLVIALARGAAGASDDEIVDDYAASAAEVRAAREEAAQRMAHSATGDERAEILRLHLESPPEAIAHALSIVAERGGAAAYLAAHGVTGAQLDALRRKHEAAR